jgi:hypothetical protein
VQAIAKASIAGGCISQQYHDGTVAAYGAYTAAALAEAKVKIDLKETTGCVDYVSLYHPYH